MKKEKGLEIQEEKINKTLDYSIKEGSYASVSSGAGENYIVPYALALNANNVQIGFLSSFVGLISSFSQIIGSRLMFKYSRKKIIISFIILQASMWLVILSLGILYYNEILKTIYAIPLLILFYTIYSIFGNLVGPSWFSLMGDLVLEKERGKYFSKRNRITGFVGMTVTLIASFFLDYMKGLGIVVIGFAVLFAISAFGRAVSAWYFTKHYFPKLKIKKGIYFSFFKFIKKAPGNNFGKFAIFIGLINFFTNFAGPFFAVYMLKHLNYSYVWFTVVNMSGSLFTILSIPVWGYIGDKYGNRYLLKVGSLLIPLPPLLWVFSGNPIYLIFTAELSAGIGWAAFNLAASNYIYDAVTPQKRGLVVSYYTVLNGIAIFLGAMAGGLFAQFVKTDWIIFGITLNIFLVIFLISAIGRAMVALIMIPKIKEVKEVSSHLKHLNLFSYVYLFTLRPLGHFFRGVHNVSSQMESFTQKNVLKFDKKGLKLAGIKL